MRVNFERDAQKQEAMWERQHEIAADKIFAMCSDLGGFFLKVALPTFHFFHSSFFNFIYVFRLFQSLIVSFPELGDSLVLLCSCKNC